MSTLNISGQNYSNIRIKKLIIEDSLSIDTLPIIPNSITITLLTDSILSDTLYSIDYINSKIQFNQAIIKQKATIKYRVFPFPFNYEIVDYEYFSNRKNNPDNNSNYTAIALPPIQNNTGDNLQIKGDISRGLSVGNSQNMTMNSNLNLQLSGEIKDNIFIDAMISDKNIPIQPSGYTQQIQDFDRIYINIYDSLRSIQMGDIQIKDEDSYFLRFNKKIMGGNFTNKQILLDNGNKITTQVSAAISRGNFNRQNIMGIEGVQGPYILHGANNEQFIIILAGTERVYIDGIKLERGENADYIINYNTAELTFTPHVVITKNSRISVEFEYSDKNYNRFMFFTKNNFFTKRSKTSIQYYSSGDAKNQPVNQSLTPELVSILENAGDDPLKSVVPGIDSVIFDKNRVLYKIIDTTVNNTTYDSVLVHSTNPDSAYYSASFTLVGTNKGNYIKSVSATNGKVFEWIAPINGIPQGNYEPVQILIPPQKKQLIIASSQITIDKNTSAYIELALSNNDKNTFSDYNNGDNKGVATKSAVNRSIKLKNNKLNIGINYEFTQKTFSSIERFRNVEYNRNWNLLKPIYANAHLLQGSINLQNNNSDKILLKSELLKYTALYDGFRNSILFNTGNSKLKISGKASTLNSTSFDNDTRFYRYFAKISYPVLKILKAGISSDFEDNRITIHNSNTLSAISKKYFLNEAFLSGTNKEQNNYKLSYSHRTDYLPYNDILDKIAETNSLSASGNIKSKIQTLQTTISWRQLSILNDSITLPYKNEQNLLGRIDHKLRAGKGVISIYSFYEINTGMETKKEYSYIEVPMGKGIYVWVDYNGNNIPELNEFEVSPFPEEANYIRIFTPTNEYIKVYSLKYNETLRLRTPHNWRGNSGIKGFLSKFENTFSFRVAHRHTQNNLLARINPFSEFIDDTMLISKKTILRNILSYNKASSKIGIDYIYNETGSKILLTSGFDNTQSTVHQLKIRWNMLSSVSLFNKLQNGTSDYNSDYFTTKNYRIESLENSTTINWQPTVRVRVSGVFSFKNKTNNLGTEHVTMQKTGPEIKINSPDKGTITARFLFINNIYSGQTDTPVAYTMMEGFKAGKNYSWTIMTARNLNKFLRLTISYTGRKPANEKIIHTGQFSVSAFF